MGADESTPQRTRKQKETTNEKKYAQAHQTLFNPLAHDTTVKYFIESPRVADGLFNLFKSLKSTTYQSFQDLICYLTKIDFDISVNQHLLEISRKTSIMDRFLMLLYAIETAETYASIQINRQQKQNCIFQFFSLFCTPSKKNLQRVYQLIQGFSQKEMLIEFSQKFKNALHYSQKFLANYFIKKFQTGKNKFQIFETVPDSNLCSMQDWIMMSMENPNICKNQPTLLYSMEKTGSSFHSLYRHIIGYKGPWLLVMSHYQTDPVTKQLRLCIFGTYQNLCVEDISQYQGNAEGFLFRLSPNQKYYTVSKGDGESNYVYINTTEVQTSKMSRGLGFGGKNKQDFKIWIDESIETKSYVGGKQCGTYGYGSVAFPSTTNLKIRDFQVWGLGDQRSLQHQQQYWQNRQDEAYKRRKVNKKDLLSGGLTNILFQKTFKHQEDVQHREDADQSHKPN